MCTSPATALWRRWLGCLYVKPPQGLQDFLAIDLESIHLKSPPHTHISSVAQRREAPIYHDIKVRLDNLTIVYYALLLYIHMLISGSGIELLVVCDQANQPTNQPTK